VFPTLLIIYQVWGVFVKNPPFIITLLHFLDYWGTFWEAKSIMTLLETTTPPFSSLFYPPSKSCYEVMLLAIAA